MGKQLMHESIKRHLQHKITDRELLYEIEFSITRWSNDPGTSGYQREPMKMLAERISFHLCISQRPDPPDTKKEAEQSRKDAFEAGQLSHEEDHRCHCGHCSVPAEICDKFSKSPIPGTKAPTPDNEQSRKAAFEAGQEYEAQCILGFCPELPGYIKFTSEKFTPGGWLEKRASDKGGRDER